MEIAGGLGIYFFGTPGRIYGLLAGVRGRAYVIGLCRRGIFYRFGAAIYSPSRGRFDSVFVLRTKIGEVNLLFDKWLKDEVYPIFFRRSWIRGNISVSRNGLYSFQLYANDPDLVAEIDRRNWEIPSAVEDEDASYYQSNDKGRYQLDCDSDW